MKIKIFVIALVWLVSGLVSAQAQVRVCSCLDKEALLNLLKEAEMGVQEVEFLYQSITKQETETGKAVMATEEQITKVNESISNAMKLFPGKNNSDEYMDPVDCSLKTTSTPSDCVTLIQKHFYEPLQKKCSERRSPNQPYYEGMDMSSYLVPVMKAYYAMRDFILQMLKSLPKNCRPNNWFGYVVYRKTQTSVTGETKQSDPSAIFSSTHTFGSKNTYIGTVFVEEGKPVSAKAYGSESRDVSTTGVSKIPCRGKSVTQVSTAGSKSFAEGETKGNASFTLSVNANQTYNLTVSFFPVEITGQTNSWKKLTDATECATAYYTYKGYDNNYTDPVTKQMTQQGYSVTGEKIKPGSPDYLEGSKIEKPPSGNSSSKQGTTSTIQTEEIQVRWMLRRLPQK